MNWFLIIVLLVSSIYDLIAAECHCKTPYDCTAFPSTPCSQVGSADRCQEGWFGPYCQKQNVARGRPANQTSTYGEYIGRPLYKYYMFTAEHAVDGRVNTSFYSKPYTCSHTTQQMLPMWTVYLNTSSTDRIHHIKLYLRRDHRGRDKGMQILVGEQMCYNWSQKDIPPIVVDVTCRQPLAGNKVTIQIPGRTFVTLCEVLIFVCSDGWFGDDCEQECNCLNSTETCDKITGACSSGCRPGFNGTDCQTPCSDGWFGDGCGERCNCLNTTETCDKITGACSSGCRTGFTGTDCQTPCSDGWFGDGCGERCNCLNTTETCDKITGACSSGCRTGFTGTDCQTPCSDGWFGDGCGERCNCLNTTETCDKITGACSSGCRTGFTGTDCQTPCSDGWFGDRCKERCNCLNTTETCDKITGACSSGCRTGFNGTDCQTPCSVGMYGVNCTSECRHCLNSKCDNRDGTCIDGCIGHFSMPFCQDCLSTHYGEACIETCGNCQGNTPCERLSGECSGGCLSGYDQTDLLCRTTCSVGMYGVNCTSECRHCLNSKCDNRDGTCIDGCIGHFSMPFCQDCLSTHYGEACNETCGNCQGNTPCERLSGECSGGCLSGYDQTDLICRTEAQSQSPVAVIPIVGGGIAVMLVIAVFLAAVVIYRRRRRITEDKGEPEIHSERMHSQYDVITMVESSTSGEQSHVYANEGPPLDDGHAGAFHEPSLDDGCGRALPRPQLDDGHAGALHEPPLDHGSCRALPKSLLDDGRAGALHEPPLDHGSGKVLPRPLLDDDPSWANSGPLLDADDEDAMFSVETDVDVDTEAAATYYNWIPPHMTLDKLPQCIMDKKKKSFEVEFQAIPYGARRSHVVGKRPENKKKNRFVALYSYDHSRVVLTEGADDYINANYIKGHDDNPKYIATQGPTPVTITDFWQMIWQENVTEIVMLTNLMEKKKKKCEQYWPAEYESDCYGDFSITNKKAVARADYTTATFLVRKSTEERVVRHFHFTSWPDHGVPSAPALVSFWRMVKQEGPKGRPMVIHCSAGVGRTGTFIALDLLMDEAENENKVNVFMCVSKMREDRMNMVQTMSQYEFVHDVVLEAIRSRGTFFTSPEFENEFGQGDTFTETQETKLRKQFQLLEESTSRLSEETVSTALLPQNAAKNRSRTILPGNKTRPHLTTRVHQRNNYINAVVLSSILRPSSLIVTQTPLPDTVVDFWRLVYDHDCCTVICLDDSKEVENMYPKENQNLKKGPFTIVLEKENSNREDYRERSLTVLYDKGCERSVVVFSLKSLDMMSHPATLLELVNSVHMVITSADHKVLVHCHDGASVSGVFCSVLNIISRLRLDRDVDIFLSIRELQCVRPQFIQSFEDYQLCYSIVKEYNRDASIYANV